MKKSGGAGKKKQPNDAIDEVEKLLTLTQDDLLLKLTVNSHTNSKFDFIPESSHNNNAIHPDLDRRFQALRSKPNPNPNPKAEIKPGDHEDIDNLLARFAALKAPANATSTSSSSNQQHGKVTKDDSFGVDFEEDDEEDEVSKIINWAIDAARLDPSPSSDIDDDDDKDDDDDDDDDDDSDEDSDDDDARRKVNRKKKGSKK
ncbi:hypothetical protein OSB04_un000304 [Centaurea solstitialis]|uniref:Uncharacterized protein n=1 Tax=Centaurea solstitialis TaxID=347529 RepID=A0AA38W2R7_9ASTR|nr:hypothetical protein OSB04_un000304 [Centaurea solstitialis]